MAKALTALKAELYSNARHSGFTAVEQTDAWRQYRCAAARLRAVKLDSLRSHAAKTAFWIDVYNGLVIDGIVTRRVRGSVLDQPDFFQAVRYRIGSGTFSLDDIEHGILRGNRRTFFGKRVFGSGDPRLVYSVRRLDPRIHFALNCGARSCPPVTAYDARHVDTELDLAARHFVNGPAVRVELASDTVRLSPLFQWYARDFGPGPRAPLRFVLRYLRPGRERRYLSARARSIRIRYLPYDWRL